LIIYSRSEDIGINEIKSLVETISYCQTRITCLNIMSFLDYFVISDVFTIARELSKRGKLSRAL